MNSKVLQGATVSEIEIKLKFLLNKGFQPTLAIAFGSHSCELETLPVVFTNANIALVGASSAGEFTGEDLTDEQIVVMLLDMDPEAFKVFECKTDYTHSFTAGMDLGRFAKTHFEDPSFILLFSMNTSGECLIAGVNEEMGHLPSIFGGMAGDDMQMKETFTFGNNHFHSNGITALVLDNKKIEVKGQALCGWKPVGVEHQITNSTDNIIYTINDKPALGLVKQYFGDYYVNTLEEDMVAMGAAQYPLQLQRGETNILRATLKTNESDGSLIMAGPVKQGDIFQFSVAPGFEVIDETISGFKEYYKENDKADALILFSCIARKMSLGPLVEDEVHGIQDIWKEPLIGFFTYGEVGQYNQDTSHFYNETCSLVLLTERV